MKDEAVEVSKGHPKLFISYSWTNQEHMDWVLRLASDLRANGVDAILDKWHLREGQDAHSFMEQMVRDENVRKVALICDKKYVERSDKREGGVGAESQIISGELYGNVEQTKFVAISVDSDENGRAILPIFIHSRIYIDFRFDENYARSFEQLLRWCFDKPLYVEPELGTQPAFLDEKAAPVIREAAIFERRVTLTNKSDMADAASDFLHSLKKSVVDLTLDLQGKPDADEIVYNEILGTAPIISSIIEVSDRALRESNAVDTFTREFHSFLEEMLGNYEKGSTTWSADVTKFYGEFLFVSVSAIYLKNEQYLSFRDFVSTPFVKMNSDFTGEAVSFTRLNTHLKSLDYRNNRLNLRRASVHSDMIKHVCELIGFNFGNYIQSDLVLFLRGVNKAGDQGWWPDSLLYASQSYGSFPWFIRATSPRIRDPFLSAIGVFSRDELSKMIDGFKSGELNSPKWSSSFNRADVPLLANLENILTSFT